MSEGSDHSDHLKWVALILAMVLAVPLFAIAFPLLVVMIAEAPWLLAAFGGLGFAGLVGLAWLGVRTGVISLDDEEATETDPLTTLQDRYAAGELGEAEFERRLDRILESDELVRRSGGDPAAGDRPTGAARREPSGADVADERGGPATDAPGEPSRAAERSTGREQAVERATERE